MGLLDGVEIVEWEGAVLGVNLGQPIVTSGILCVTGGDTLFPNDFGEDLLMNGDGRCSVSYNRWW